MKFFSWLRQSNILKTLKFPNNFENVELRYVSGDSFDEDGIDIRIEWVERPSIYIDFSTDIDIDSLEIYWNSCRTIGCSSISKFLELIISFVANEAELILI